MFSEGALGAILGTHYPYTRPIGIIVNQYIYGPSNLSNGNTGMFAYGFADFGFVGMLIASLIFIILLKILDGTIKNIPVPVVVAAMSYQMISLNDVNIWISINTGGILLTLMVLVILDSVLKETNTESPKRVV
jgi:hypothetical protein